MNDGNFYSIAKWEIPYFGIEHKIIVIPCQSRDLMLSYAVIATIVHLYYYYSLQVIYKAKQPVTPDQQVKKYK